MMTEKLRDVLQEEAGAARVPPTDLGPVLRAGGRAVRRRRFAGSAAVAAVMALAVAIAPSIAEWSGDDTPAVAGAGPIDFSQREVTYALGSTIYLGDHEIDVSPHELYTFTQTDDGFVFSDGGNRVYFTDGGGIDQIGDRLRGHMELVSDDSGSYVGWMEAGSDGPNEAVVYDTASQDEVFRAPDGNQAGCYPNPNDNSGAVPRIDAIDGDLVYLCNADGVVAWDLTTQRRLGSWSARTISGISDAAGGYVVENVPGRSRSVPVVSREPGADGPRFPEFDGAGLSPSATYVAGSASDTPDRVIRILDRETRKDVTADLGGDYYQGGMWWLDDDRYVFQTIPDGGEDTSAVEMLECSVSSGRCTVAASFHVEPGEFTMPQ